MSIVNSCPLFVRQFPVAKVPKKEKGCPLARNSLSFIMFKGLFNNEFGDLVRFIRIDPEEIYACF